MDFDDLDIATCTPAFPADRPYIGILQRFEEIIHASHRHLILKKDIIRHLRMRRWYRA